MYVSYSMVVLYIMYYTELHILSQKYHPKSSLKFPLQQFGSIGLAYSQAKR